MFNKKILITGLVILTACGGVALAKTNDTKDNSTKQVSVETELPKEKEVAKVDDKLEEKTQEKEEMIKEEVVEANITKEDVNNNKEEIKSEDNLIKEESDIKRTDLNNFLFIGDSFTVGIQGIIKANNPNVYIHAKSSTMPSYWLDKVSDMPSNDKVEGISLLIGVNGASRPSNLVDAKELINRLLAKYPDKIIYVQKVFPVGKEFGNANPDKFNKSIKTYNEGLKAFCDTKENVKFIDTTSGYVDENGYLIKHNGDGLHIAYEHSKGFYQNIKNEILNLINN